MEQDVVVVRGLAHLVSANTILMAEEEGEPIQEGTQVLDRIKIPLA